MDYIHYVSQNFEIDFLFSLRLETRGFPVHNALASTSFSE